MHKRFLLLLLPALMLVGCGDKPKDISDLKDATPADSMMYYFGAMQANSFWQDAESDTTLRSEEARREFIEGFRAAMKMDKDDSSYNKGLQLGLRLALRLREFENRYGVKFSEEILASSLENFLRSDSLVNIADAQRGFYKIKDRLDLATANKEIEGAKGNLAQESKSRGFTMVSDTLYGKDITPPGPGPKIKEGDRVAVEVTASTLDGKEIVARQFPDSLTIGSGRVPRIVGLGIQTMTPGQTRTFMTTPRTLFGKRYALYNLPSEQPVIFTVKVVE